jgi:non-canonical (house-cleaning) NTP pyrophosphatase
VKNLEGGLFILSEENSEGHYGNSMSTPIPKSMAHAVVAQERDLSKVIDQSAGRPNVREHDGASGFLRCGLLDRQRAFEVALLAALAPYP